MAITGSAIGTLILFVVSIVFVIYPVSLGVPLGKYGKRRIPIDLTTAPILAIAILWAAQCLGPTEIRLGIVGSDGVKPYNILILFFSLAYMAITLDITGLLKAAAFWVSNKGGTNGRKLFIYFYLMLTALSVVLGNDPVILSGTVFLVYYTEAQELNPVAWLISEFAAANTASMVLFLGNPTNVVICEGFRVNNVAFTAYTILPFIGCSVTCLAALAVQFRSHKYIHKLEPSTLDVRKVLLDPKGALVGSLLLGSCLVVIIIVSFFHVDVWKITLPFAVAKFLFDLGWDQYRRRHNIPILGKTLNDIHDSVDPDDEEVDVMADQFNLQHQHNITEKHVTEEPVAIANGNNSSIATPTTSSPSSRSNSDGTANSEKTLLSKPAFELPSALPAIPGSPVNEGIKPRSDSYPPKDARISSSSLSSKRTADKPPQAEVMFPAFQTWRGRFRGRFYKLFPTLYTALPRLPFALVPFAFSQFILIEALAHQGWIDIFARWLVIASGRQIFPTIWLIGVLGVILCNISGTNIGATILLTKIVRASSMPDHTARAAAIALAVASNIGAVSFTFSASLAGLLWNQILEQKKKAISQYNFAKYNALPLLTMTAVGLGVVCAEMAVLYKGSM